MTNPPRPAKVGEHHWDVNAHRLSKVVEPGVRERTAQQRAGSQLRIKYSRRAFGGELEQLIVCTPAHTITNSLFVWAHYRCTGGIGRF